MGGWNDKLVVVPGHAFTFGVFTTQSVKLKGDRLIIEGTRGTLMRDGQKNLLGRAGDAPMKLEIDLHNAPATLQLPMLEKMLFFENAATAFAGLPMPFSEMLPFNTTGRTPTKCGCTMIFDGGQWIKLAHDEPRPSPPKLKFSVSPEFSEEMRQKKISGGVAVAIYVNSTGHVEDVWVGRPLGFGLDGKAVEAVRQYVFDPAMYAGRPVGTMLNMEVNFQVF
jgi:TonB family protein